MKLDKLGLCPLRLVSSSGVLAEVPYGIPSQGLVVSSRASEAVVAILPVMAVEDPRYGSVVNRNGIYRLEDRTSSIARLGQGRILDRIRRHRAAPILFPWRLISAVPRDAEWSVHERCYLEARWAARWRRNGHALASSTFMTSFRELPAARQRELDHCLDEIDLLVSVGRRLFDGDPADEFVAATSPSPWPHGAGGPHGGLARSFSRTYAVGTRLVYERGPLWARAVVAPRSVVLQPKSYVRLGLSLSVGARFAAIHSEFLTAAGVVALGHALGRTTRAVESPSAAALIKRVSAGRVHNADRWQPYPPHPLGHQWSE